VLLLVIGGALAIAAGLVVFFGRPGRTTLGRASVPKGVFASRGGGGNAARGATGPNDASMATFPCPYCGADRPAEPVRCPTCGVF
jgi:hypothetical protein